MNEFNELVDFRCAYQTIFKIVRSCELPIGTDVANLFQICFWHKSCGHRRLFGGYFVYLVDERLFSQGHHCQHMPFCVGKINEFLFLLKFLICFVFFLEFHGITRHCLAVSLRYSWAMCMALPISLLMAHFCCSFYRFVCIIRHFMKCFNAPFNNWILLTKIATKNNYFVI